VWRTAPPEFISQIQFGTTLGILCQDLECLCCGYFKNDRYFFFLADLDAIFSRIELKFDSIICLDTILPSGHLGRFELEMRSPVFNDNYIINLIAISHEFEFYGNITLQLLFEGINKRIRMRTMFNRLYFRCFRQAFAPGKSAAIRNYVQMFNDMHFVHTDKV
jgi:hypothetical protein